MKSNGFAGLFIKDLNERKLPSDYGMEGILLLSKNTKSLKRGDVIDFYDKQGDKKSGKIKSITNIDISVVASGVQHDMKIKYEM